MPFATPSSRRTWVAVGALVLATLGATVPVARADIFEWEYVDSADPSLRKRESGTLVPDGAGRSAAPGANFRHHDLTKAHLIDRDLTGALFFNTTLTDADLSRANLTQTNFERANLTDADFTGAEVRGAGFVDVTSRGFTAAQLYATASYQAHDLTGIVLSRNNLNGWDFVGQNLTNAYFHRATLIGADLTDAEVRGANLDDITRFGFTASQLYATASYQARDLTRIYFGYNDLSGWNFSGQNLANASFSDTKLIGADFSHANLTNVNFLYSVSNLTGTDLTGADMRGARPVPIPADAITDNVISYGGRIFGGLNLQAGEKLMVRDYDGRSSTSPSPILIPIRVADHFTMANGGVLRMVFEADAWDSTISFDAGIPVDLGGVLELAFAADVDLVSQIGRTFQVFDWDRVAPVGQFGEVQSDFVWDLSQLYTSGNVTLVALTPVMAGDYNGDGVVDGQDYEHWHGQYGITAPPGSGADGNGDGVVNAADYTVWRDALAAASASSAVVPEPASLALFALTGVAFLGVRDGRAFARV